MLDERHLRLYRACWANAFHRPGHRPICVLSQHRLAQALNCSTRTVRRLLADLRQPGADVRHPGVPGAGERCGYITVYPLRRLRGGRRGGRGAGGGRLYVGDRLVLNVDLLALEGLIRGQLYAPAQAAALVSSMTDRLAFPQVEVQNRRSYRRDTPMEAKPAGHTEGTGEAVSLVPRGIEGLGGTNSYRGGPSSPGGTPSAQPPPRPGEPGYQRWEEDERRRKLAELLEAFPEADS